MKTLQSGYNISNRVERALRTVGKNTFLKLYPFIKQDINIEIEDIVLNLSFYKDYKLSSQKTKLNTTKRIIREGWEREALENISLSNKLNPDDIKLALDYLKKL